MNNIAVIGAGTMGNGIAHVFAQYGFSVHLTDLNEKQLEKGMALISKNMERQVQKGLLSAEDKGNALLRIQPILKLDEGVQGSDLIIEAATENESVKLQIFRELGELKTNLSNCRYSVSWMN
jgi:3-hydroxybutyryl-CoA dehydrogenase